MKHYLSPSLMCCDLLNVERDLHILEKTGMDMIHYDIMDTSFTTGTMLPALMLERVAPVSYTHLRAHETGRNLVCRLLLEKKKKTKNT